MRERGADRFFSLYVLCITYIDSQTLLNIILKKRYLS